MTSQSPSSTKAYIQFPPQTNEALFSHNGSLLFTAVEGQTQITAFPSADPVYSINMSGKTSIQSLDLDPKGRCAFFVFPLPISSGTDRRCDMQQVSRFWRERYDVDAVGDGGMDLHGGFGSSRVRFSHFAPTSHGSSSLRPCPVASHPLHLSAPST